MTDIDPFEPEPDEIVHAAALTEAVEDGDADDEAEQKAEQEKAAAALAKQRKQAALRKRKQRAAQKERHAEETRLDISHLRLPQHSEPALPQIELTWFVNDVLLHAQESGHPSPSSAYRPDNDPQYRNTNHPGWRDRQTGLLDRIAEYIDGAKQELADSSKFHGLQLLAALSRLLFFAENGNLNGTWLETNRRTDLFGNSTRAGGSTAAIAEFQKAERADEAKRKRAAADFKKWEEDRGI